MDGRGDAAAAIRERVERHAASSRETRLLSLTRRTEASAKDRWAYLGLPRHSRECPTIKLALPRYASTRTPFQKAT
jgi:hypothetical protein